MLSGKPQSSMPILNYQTPFPLNWPLFGSASERTSTKVGLLGQVGEPMIGDAAAQKIKNFLESSPCLLLNSGS